MQLTRHLKAIDIVICTDVVVIFKRLPALIVCTAIRSVAVWTLSIVYAVTIAKADMTDYMERR